MFRDSVSKGFPSMLFFKKMTIIYKKTIEKVMIHPQENLAKFDYKSHMKYNVLAILPYFQLHNENKV